MANLCRMTIALILLGIWAHVWGQGIQGASLRYFLLSGMIGFGFGDVALYMALPRIGPRLTIMLNQCLAAPIAAAVELAWMGIRLTVPQVVCSATVLMGVAMALAPDRSSTASRRMIVLGTVFGVFASTGQALGAVFSRKAYQVATLDGFMVDAGTASYQRMLGGILIGALFAVAVMIHKRRGVHWERLRAGAPWSLLNAVAGPVIGIACYQWALATTPSGIVLPIVAVSPVLVMPLAYWIDGERPSKRSISGGILAVAASVALSLVR